MEKTAILTVSIQSRSNRQTAAAHAITAAIAKRFPYFEMRAAVTGRAAGKQLKYQGTGDVPVLEEAFARAASDGIRTLVVQPLYLLCGYEYRRLLDTVKTLGRAYGDKFEKIVPGTPLLTTDTDYGAVVGAMMQKNAPYGDGATAICFMGHGSAAGANCAYTKIQDQLLRAGGKDYYIGTLQAEPSLGTVMRAMQAHGGYQKVMLRPFMVAAGRHVLRDMAGEQDGSWKRILEHAGYTVECRFEGLGEIAAVQDIYVAHVQAAVRQVAGAFTVQVQAAGNCSEITFK